MKHLFFALRPRHWLKNLLIFMPLIFAKKLGISTLFLKTSLAFLIFSMMSSAVYLINDILDLEKDKLHRTKRLRPIASKRLKISDAKMVACMLALWAIIFSFALNGLFGWFLGFYFLLNILYTIILKHLVIIDVFCLGVFFALRVVAGTLVTDVEYSHWMFFMIILLALFLGFQKRRQELILARRNAPLQRSVLRKYSPYFIDQMIAVLTSSLVIVYMLYTVDSRTVGEFGNNHLVFSIPFVYYGIFRYLYLVHKWKRVEDPTDVLLSDFPLFLDVLLWMGVCIAVIYFKI